MPAHLAPACAHPHAQAAERAVRASVAEGRTDAVLPGMILNLSKAVTYSDAALRGAQRTLQAGRLECTMQNLADCLSERRPERLASEADRAALATFVVFNTRRKVCLLCVCACARVCVCGEKEPTREATRGRSPAPAPPALAPAAAWPPASAPSTNGPPACSAALSTSPTTGHVVGQAQARAGVDRHPPDPGRLFLLPDGKRARPAAALRL
jgi:hypothetical protein